LKVQSIYRIHHIAAGWLRQTFVKDITMIQKFILVPAAAALIALTGCGSTPTNQQVGTGVGAVVGGVAGNAVFGGVLGTVGGAAAGAVIGNEVGKKK
jgi:osmotically inducible lipoprotein OsmB